MALLSWASFAAFQVAPGWASSPAAPVPGLFCGVQERHKPTQVAEAAEWFEGT